VLKKSNSMKQISTLFFLLIVVTSLSAQESTSAIVKKWKLVEVEEFGEKYALTDAQKNDFIEFTADNKYKGLINGLAIEGSWVDKVGKYIITPSKDKSVFKTNWIRVISVDSGKLLLNYQSTDLIQTKLGYSAE
jgi:hypothetical protein